MLKKNRPSEYQFKFSVISAALALASTSAAITPKAAAAEQHGVLEETIVTAQRREENLQDTPIAISTMSSDDMLKQGMSSLLDLRDGSIPALKIAPFPNDPSVLQMGIRGISQSDVGQFTKELAVGVYQDGIYFGRAQGLGMELVDIERIEVLRGPQGTLYGRNAIGGAVNIITSKPSTDVFTGQFTATAGNFGLTKYGLNLNLPLGDRAALLVSHSSSERDGWVRNDIGSDYNMHDKEGSRIALRFNPTEVFTIDYAYDESDIRSTQVYYQIREIENEVSTGLPWANLALEPDRLENSRFDLNNDPGETDISGHALTLSWFASENHEFKYLGSFREIDGKLQNNYGGAFLVGNTNSTEDSQEQTSHELQLQGSFLEGGLQYTAGIFYYEEETDEQQQTLISLLPVGQDGLPLAALSSPSPTNLPVTLLPYYQRDELGPVGSAVLGQIQGLLGTQGNLLRSGNAKHVTGESESFAAYTQWTWTPGILDNNLELTLGVRYTDEEKHFERLVYDDLPEGLIRDYEGDNVDPAVTVNYHWSPDISTWAKWSSGWRSGGINSRSETFAIYDADEIEMYELGWKTMLWDQRVRFNGALFTMDWIDKQIDFSDPNEISISETINATGDDPKHQGVEVDLTVLPLPGWLVALDYIYLDVDSPDQRNTVTGQMQRFPASFSFVGSDGRSGSGQAASLKVSYEVPLNWATVEARASANWSEPTFFNATDLVGGDEYTLINASLVFSDINFQRGRNSGLTVTVWGRNLTDEEWITHQIQSTFSLASAYGDPRTYGITLSYDIGD
tara:strand:- start:19388 stop:21769 length:2382 start_codon:yes stop_codon:yes gene_type:complete